MVFATVICTERTESRERRERRGRRERRKRRERRERRESEEKVERDEREEREETYISNIHPHIHRHTSVRRPTYLLTSLLADLLNELM